MHTLFDTAYSAHPVLAITAEAVLPLLGVMTLLLPALAWRAGRLNNPGLLWTCGFASIALVYLAREVNLKTGALMDATGFHFSSHTAVAVSFAMTLVAFRLFLIPVATGVVGGYLWLMVYLHYHVPGDILITAVVILPLSALCHVPWWKRNASHAKRSS